MSLEPAACFDARTAVRSDFVRNSRLRPRLLWLLLRRAVDDGRVPIFGRLQALAAKRRRPAAALVGVARIYPCRWLPVGPRNINGRIKCLAVDPVNGFVVYAGAADGGVWKTVDGGQSWAPTMHDQESLSIGALAVDRNAPNVVYAGTGEALIDDGLSPYAWAYPGAGVYKSVDGAATWALMPPIANDYIYRIAVDPFDSTNVFCAGFAAGGTGAGGLCRWDDTGAAWVVTAAGTFSDVVFDPLTPGVVYAAQHHAGVARWVRNGGQWLKDREWLPPVPLRINVAAGVHRAVIDGQPVKRTYVYARLESTGQVYRTTDGGATWSLRGKPPVDLDENGNEVFARWWCSHLAADRDDADVIYAGGIDLARSANGGQTWTPLTKSYNSVAVDPRLATHPDHHDIVFDPNDRARFYAANDGGVFVGTLTGAPAAPVTWRKVSTGLAVTQFYDLGTSAASRSMFGGGCQDNGTLVTTGGLSWRHVYGGDGSYVAFHPTTPWTMWAARWAGGTVVVQRSQNGGTDFHSADAGLAGAGENPVTVIAMDPSDPRTVFVGTNRVYRTTDGDASPTDWRNGTARWHAASNVIGSVTEITIVTSLRIYAGTIDGGLHCATNGGVNATSFVAVPRPPGHAWPARWLSGITVRPGPPDTVFLTFHGSNATGVSDHVWRGVFDPATNTWPEGPDPISTGLEDAPVGALVIDPSTPTTLYVATDVGVYRSVDDGASWHAFDQGLPNVPVVDLAIEPVHRLLRAATHGRGMYERQLKPTCPPIDLYVRDNILDTGEVPSPSGEWDPTSPNARVYHWQSADIKVDAPPYDPVDVLVDGVEFDDPVHRLQPLPPLGYRTEDVLGVQHNRFIGSVDNRIYVQVHNRGSRSAASVVVRLLWARSTLGALQLPADFWPGFDTDTYTQTRWHLVGRRTINDLHPAVPRVLRFDWRPVVLTASPVALLLIVDSDEDPVPRGERDVNALVRSSKHVALKCVQVMSVQWGRPRWTVLQLQRALPESRAFTLWLEAAHRTGWSVVLVVPRSLLGDRVGFREVAGGVENLSRSALLAEHGTIDPDLANLLRMRRDLVAIEMENERADLRDVLIEAGGSVAAALVVTRVGPLHQTDDLQIDLIQHVDDRLVGGMTFRVHVVAPVMPEQ